MHINNKLSVQHLLFIYPNLKKLYINIYTHLAFEYKINILGLQYKKKFFVKSPGLVFNDLSYWIYAVNLLNISQYFMRSPKQWYPWIISTPHYVSFLVHCTWLYVWRDISKTFYRLRYNFDNMCIVNGKF